MELVFFSKRKKPFGWNIPPPTPTKNKAKPRPPPPHPGKPFFPPPVGWFFLLPSDYCLRGGAGVLVVPDSPDAPYTPVVLPGVIFVVADPPVPPPPGFKPPLKREAVSKGSV